MDGNAFARRPHFHRKALPSSQQLFSTRIVLAALGLTLSPVGVHAANLAATFAQSGPTTSDVPSASPYSYLSSATTVFGSVQTVISVAETDCLGAPQCVGILVYYSTWPRVSALRAV